MPLVDVARIPQVALAFQIDDHAKEGRLLNALADASPAMRDGRGAREAVEAPLDRLVAHTREPVPRRAPSRARLARARRVHPRRVRLARLSRSRDVASSTG